MRPCPPIKNSSCSSHLPLWRWPHRRRRAKLRATTATAASSWSAATTDIPARTAYGYPWYGAQWGPYPYPPPYGYYGWIDASVRLEVTPRDAEVYVDGYYAGTVDDFDGTFQRLRVEPGQHDLEIYQGRLPPAAAEGVPVGRQHVPDQAGAAAARRGRADGAAAAAGESAAGRAAVRAAAAERADAARPVQPARAAAAGRRPA